MACYEGDHPSKWSLWTRWQCCSNDDSIAFINFDSAALIKDGSGSTIIIDTGTHKNLLRDYQNFLKPRIIHAANKASFIALGIGSLVLTNNIKGKVIDISLKNTLYAPDTAFTLISIGGCDDANYHTEFSDQRCTIKNCWLYPITSSQAI